VNPSDSENEEDPDGQQDETEAVETTAAQGRAVERARAARASRPPPPAAAATQSTAVPPGKKKKPTGKVHDDFEAHMMATVSGSQDEDSLYCLSLVDSIKQLDPRKKRIAKIKIQKLLFDLEFDEDDYRDERYNRQAHSQPAAYGPPPSYVPRDTYARNNGMVNFASGAAPMMASNTLPSMGSGDNGMVNYTSGVAPMMAPNTLPSIVSPDTDPQNMVRNSQGPMLAPDTQVPGSFAESDYLPPCGSHVRLLNLAHHEL
jgi:hypothetical protein